MILYIYNIIIKDKKVKNNVKRRFYYALNQKFGQIKTSLTKSTIILPQTLENEADTFFIEWRGYLNAYKIKTESIEKIVEETPL